MYQIRIQSKVAARDANLEAPFQGQNGTEDAERPDHVIFGHHDTTEEEGCKPDVDEVEHTQKWACSCHRK